MQDFFGEEDQKEGDKKSPLDKKIDSVVKKFRSVKLGDELNVPLGQTWSCYKGQKLHCGMCGTCIERREAFQLAGVTDPTIYDNV